MAKARYIAAVLVLSVGTALAAEPRLAEHKSFIVPLASGENGSAIALQGGNEQILVLATQGNPPILSLYRLIAFDAPGPQPEPEPNPQPDPSPNPNPNPQPIPHGPISLIWIEESSERTPEQAKAITDQAIRDALKKAGWSLRIADVDVINEYGQPPDDLAAFIAAARRDGVPRLFATDDKGAEIFNGKAPANRDEFLAILRRLGLKDVATSETQAKSNSCSNGNCQTRTRYRLFR